MHLMPHLAELPAQIGPRRLDRAGMGAVPLADHFRENINMSSKAIFQSVWRHARMVMLNQSEAHQGWAAPNPINPGCHEEPLVLPGFPHSPAPIDEWT